MRAALAIMMVVSVAMADRFHGFAVSNATIQLDDILSGGPPRGGIPAIDNPHFIAPAEAGFLQDGDEVISVTVEGETRAYPLRILVWHEIVNDEIAEKPIAVTYCPLCGTAMVFSRKVDARILDFGVSGLLYQSDVLLYDRQTESLWSQVKGGAVTGPMTGTRFRTLPSTVTSWKKWRTKHPDTKVLSRNTGHSRDYAQDPYDDYYARRGAGVWRLFKPGLNEEEKELVAGVEVDGKAIPSQVADVRRSQDDGSVVAFDVWFFADIPAGTGREYTITPGKASPPGNGVQIKQDDSSVQLTARNSALQRLDLGAVETGAELVVAPHEIVGDRHHLAEDLLG